MTGVIATLPKIQFSNALGLPMAGGTLTSYLSGTTTLAATYQDEALTAANTNPITLDSRGECTLWLDSTKTYKFVLKNALGVVQWTVDNITNSTAFAKAHADLLDAALRAALSARGGAALVGYASSATSQTTAQLKLRESVSVEDFGALGDGVADDTAAILRALASFESIAGTLYFTKSLYKVSAPILVSLSGMRLVGKSALGCYLLSGNGQTFDLMRVAGSNVEITGFIFRPGSGAQLCLNVYSSRAYIHHNRFLAGTSGSNTAILLSSDNPLGVNVPGAYNHIVEGNEIGLVDFSFALGVDQTGSTGQQANTVLNNKIVCGVCIKTRSGGGNTYTGNLLQSPTGTFTTGAGNGFDFDPGVVGETVTGNYIERFQHGIISRNTTIYSGGDFGPNHNDNNTNNISFPSKGNSFYISSQEGVARWNEWQMLPEWNGNWRLKSGFYANPSIEVMASVNSVRVNSHGVYAEQRALNTGSTILPNIGCVKVSGNGSASTGLTLAAGYYDGQILHMIGNSWPATFLAANCIFSAAGVPTFGNGVGQIASMTLLYSSGENKWYEMARTVRP